MAVYRTGVVLKTAYADCMRVASADVSDKPEFVIITTYDTLQARHLDWKPEIRVSETEQLTAY